MSQNQIHCTECGHLGKARVVANSVEYQPTGLRQFDIGFLVARIVTLFWCLIALTGVVALNIAGIDVPKWAPLTILYCYAIALITSVTYAAVCMTPFDSGKVFVIASAPAAEADRKDDLPYAAFADVRCSQCGNQFPHVAIMEVVPRIADPFR